jgi:hypothetical protein
MPEYRVRDSRTGRSVTLRGDSPPTEAELEQVFAALPPLQSTAPPSAATAGMVPQSTATDPAPTGGPSVLDRALDLLPAAGGMTGGLVGGTGGTVFGAGVGGAPGAVVGATLGGGAGEAFRQLINRARGKKSPASASEAATGIATEGGVQGAAEATGTAMVKGAVTGGRFLMNRALNRVSERLANEFPELSQTLIDNAISVTKGGYKKAQTLLMKAKAEANAALDAAHAAGATVPIQSATSGLNNTLSVIANSSDPVGNLSRLIKVEQRIMGGRSATLTMREADALKTSLQREARQVYAAAKAPNGKPHLSIEAQALADMAAALNDAIEAAATQAGATGYKAANATARDMIGATRGVKQAIRPNANLYQAMVRPSVGAILGGAGGYTQDHPILGALAGTVATSPRMMSREAIALANPATQGVIRQAPRTLTELLIALTQQQAASQSGAPAGSR